MQTDYETRLTVATATLRKRISTSESKVRKLLSEGRITQEQADYANRVLSVTQGLGEARAALKLGNFEDFVNCNIHTKSRIASIYYCSPEGKGEKWGKINQARYNILIKYDLGLHILLNNNVDGRS